MNYRFEIEESKNSGEKYIVLKGSEDKSSKLDIPDYIDTESDGRLPVRIIGNHAFSSRKEINEIVIPETINTILGFAFHNCSNLKKISLTDSVTEYLDGGIRQCENLEEIEIDLKYGNYAIIRRLLEDNDRRVAFRLHYPDGVALLVFPGFNYDFVENTMARTIQFAIEGSGYAYRECVKSDGIHFREYDLLFSKSAADDSVTAEKIAMARLLNPYELTEEAADNYETWLSENAGTNLVRAVTEQNDSSAHMAFYTERGLLPEKEVAGVIETAVSNGKAEIVSMLMDYRQKSFDSSESEMLEMDF